MRNFREKLVAQVKASGEELIARAEDLVGHGEYITDFEIRLHYNFDEVPTVELIRTHANHRACKIMADI